MLNLIVKVDNKKGSHRITIPKIIRELMGWTDAALYKICIQDDETVTIEEYLSHDDISK